MRNYGNAVKLAELRVAQYWSAVIEPDARSQAPWTDRTGNARMALRAYTNENPPGKFGAADADEYPNPNDLARDVVALYLSHGMNYGLYLETRFQGKYAIILPTLQRYYPRIAAMLKDIFK
jgi:hypothetical protein